MGRAAPSGALLGVGPNREHERDPSRRSEIEASFRAEDDRTTEVAIEHRKLSRHGGDTEAYRHDLQQGWEHLLERYAAAAGGAE